MPAFEYPPAQSGMRNANRQAHRQAWRRLDALWRRAPGHPPRPGLDACITATRSPPSHAQLLSPVPCPCLSPCLSPCLYRRRTGDLGKFQQGYTYTHSIGRSTPFPVLAATIHPGHKPQPAHPPCTRLDLCNRAAGCPGALSDACLDMLALGMRRGGTHGMHRIAVI